MSTVYRGSTGVRIRIRVVDDDGEVVNLAVATSVVVALFSPRGRVEVTPEYVTDGSDGLLEAAVPDDAWIRASRVDYQVLVEFAASSFASTVGRITVAAPL